jgi:hypothetical protein
VKNATVVNQLKSAAQVGDIHTVIRLLNENKKNLTLRESRIYGELTFAQLAEAINNGIITNQMNREEELYDKNNYKNKLNHFIRFIDGISRKSHLQLSYVPIREENRLYISDDGTMMSLAFGQFSDAKTLNGKEIAEIVTSIELDYDIVDSNKLEFLSNIREWLNSLTEQQLGISYSLKDIISNSKSTQMFNTTSILAEINLYSIKQHLKDQQNANLQPNPWIDHNFYKAPVKALDEYSTEFLGDSLIDDVFSDVPGFGTDINRKGRRLFRTYGRSVKRAELEKPFYMVKSALLQTDNSLKTVLETNKYIINYSKHEHKVYGQYWYDAYAQMVRTCKYDDMVEFVELFKTVQNCDWGLIADTIEDIRNNTTCGAFQDFTPYKDDFGIFMTYVILAIHQSKPKAFSRTEKENIKEITKKMINEISDTLAGTISAEIEGTIVTDTVFNIFNEYEGFKNWDSRFKYVWEPAIKSVWEMCESNKKAENKFDKEVAHQRNAIIRVINEYGLSMVHKGYSHVDGDIITINFNDTTKTMAGLHCVPRADGGTVEDGVIWGLTKDNTGSWQYLNLNTKFSSPSDYWASLGEHNQVMLDKNRDKLPKNIVRDIQRFITLCDAINETGISYKFKK